MVVDDLANRPHDCDLLLDQNFYLRLEERYSGLVSSRCVCLLGPKYSLLRKEFTQSLKTKDCTDRKSIDRLFVFMGGSDPTNETEKVIEALDKLSNSGIKADIVVSSVNPLADYIQKMCAERECCSFYKDVENIGELMFDADMAIGAGGATTIERCYIGLPSLVIMVAENQKETSLAFNDVGALCCIGWHTDVMADDIYTKLRFYMDNLDELKVMCMNAKQVVDRDNYCGINGVISEML
jgi:UDP-2,4-diacetamido-2,4,6-trideoxy-beta-L-altropyranose hydrolase